MLPTGTKIVFTYNLTNMTALNYLQARGQYDFTQSGNHFVGTAFDSTFVPASASGTINGLASAPLVFATANISGNVGTTTITNLSTGYANFQTLFAGIFHGSVAGLTYAVSSVPLPAALPMFLSLMGGMFAFARKRRKATVSA